MTVTLSLSIIGDDEHPLWVTYMTPAWSFFRPQDCCATGHASPEEAASHGAALAAIWLSQYARSLKPPAWGALALAKAG